MQQCFRFRAQVDNAPRLTRRRRRRSATHVSAGQQSRHSGRSLLRRHTNHARRNRSPGRGACLRCRTRARRRRTSQSLQAKFPVTEIFSHIEVTDGRVWIKPDGIQYFAGDLSQDEQKLVWAEHAAPVADLFTQKVEGTAWRSKPSWYIVANNDRTIQPELERFVAKRMKATTFETDSSHVPMLSQPGLVLDVIRKAVKAVQENIRA
jgi:pimeloyl-ACP methyl ester carboxylesterase